VPTSIDHYANIFRQASATPGFINKLGVIFNKPGWQPTSLGGHQAPPQVEKETYRKYDITASLKIRAYAFFQFIIALAITAFYLFRLDSYSLFDKCLFSILIITYIVTCGGMLEKKTWAPILETGKLITITVIAYYLYSTSPMVLAIALYSIASFIWLIYLRAELSIKSDQST